MLNACIAFDIVAAVSAIYMHVMRCHRRKEMFATPTTCTQFPDETPSVAENGFLEESYSITSPSFFDVVFLYCCCIKLLTRHTYSADLWWQRSEVWLRVTPRHSNTAFVFFFFA